MIGKGWLIIGGILVLLILYSAISVAGLKGDVKGLRGDVTELQNQATTVETAAPEPVESGAPTEDETASNDLSTAEGRDAQRKQDLGKIAEAIVAFDSDNGFYPNQLNQLTPDFLDRIPADPSAPKYNYRYKHEGDTFTLTCILEQSGDPDDTKGDGQADKVFTINQDFRTT